MAGWIEHEAATLAGLTLDTLDNPAIWMPLAAIAVALIMEGFDRCR